MKKTSLLIFLFFCVAFSQEQPATADYSEFENSLMAPASEMDSAESVSAESVSEDGVDSASSPVSAFEQSLMSSPSQMEPVYRLRQDLLSAVKAKDSAAVGVAVDQLLGMESRSMIPIREKELEVVYIEMKMFERLLDMMLKYYKTLFDPPQYDPNPVVASSDDLESYVDNSIDKRDPMRNVYYSISSQIDNSQLSEVKKEKLEMMLLLCDAYREGIGTGYRVRELAEDFLNRYPDDPDAHWIEKSVLSPLTRMDLYEYNQQNKHERKAMTIQDKLYTGGLGLNVFLLMGGMGIGFDKLYRKDMFEASSSPSVNFEIYLQIHRIALLAEMVNSGVEGVYSLGLGTGFVAYDSPYLKIRPYFALALAGMSMNSKEKNLVEYVDSGDYGFDIDSGISSTLAVNVDFKFATMNLFNIYNKLASFSLVGKFGASYIQINDEYVNGDGISLFFAIGLGSYFW